jgi:hypothetical protein
MVQKNYVNYFLPSHAYNDAGEDDNLQQVVYAMRAKTKFAGTKELRLGIVVCPTANKMKCHVVSNIKALHQFHVIREPPDAKRFRAIVVFDI